MPTFILIVLLASFASCQSLEEGWKGIRPLRTDKAVVDKLLGPPELDSNGYHRYRIGEAFVRINYSTEPCSDAKMGRGEYNVPKDTVLEYSVHPAKLVLLSEMDFKKSKYVRDTSGDTNSILLVNNEDGVILGVQSQEGTEYFAGADFRPSKKDADKFKCNYNINNRVMTSEKVFYNT